MTNIDLNDVSIRYAIALTEKFDDLEFTVDRRGRKFDRIVYHNLKWSDGNTVHAFVERATGALIKAASWTAPQKNSDGTFAVRHMLDTDETFTATVEKADWSGRYLYAR